MSEFEKGSQCFATLLSDDKYFNGVSVLIKTLQKHNPESKIPIVVLVDETRVSSTTIKRLSSMCSEVKAVQPLVHKATAPHTSAGEGSDQPSWASSEMTKLHIWDLTTYEQVFYIDADCMVIGNISNVFEQCQDVDFAAAPDVFPPDRFNAGVMVIKPSSERFAELCLALETLPSYDGGDTGFLNAFMPDWYVFCSMFSLPFLVCDVSISRLGL
jgi:glycogenin glucosyltransferase